MTELHTASVSPTGSDTRREVPAGGAGYGRGWSILRCPVRRSRMGFGRFGVEVPAMAAASFWLMVES